MEKPAVFLQGNAGPYRGCGNLRGSVGGRSSKRSSRHGRGKCDRKPFPASDETVGKADYRRELVKSQSARLLCAYIYATAGYGESTQDLVFGGQHLICENGVVLKEAEMFQNQSAEAVLDINRLSEERRRISTWHEEKRDGYLTVEFSIPVEETKLERFIDPNPFVPDSRGERERRCNEILMIQAMGLKKRLEHTHCKRAVLESPEGLDSTLALLVTARAFDLLGMGREHITAVTMPCFGTTDRTYTNACELTRRLGATLMEVDIKKAVLQHFSDIGHDENVHDVTYENSQARERTPGDHGYCQPAGRHGSRNGRPFRVGPWLGYL